MRCSAALRCSAVRNTLAGKMHFLQYCILMQQCSIAIKLKIKSFLLDFVSRKSIDFIFEDHKLPSIPATVIGFGDAKKLLQEMQGSKAPQLWQGLLPLDYNLGGRFRSATK